MILTDKADLDVIDMQERIRLAFPNTAGDPEGKSAENGLYQNVTDRRIAGSV